MDRLKDRWEAFEADHPRIRNIPEAVKPYAPPVNFITVHYAYFIGVTLVGTLVFWGASNPSKSIGWWDCMFMCVSAMTATGLNSVNRSEEHTSELQSHVN